MEKDEYINGMDWGEDEVNLSSLENYRIYQYNLIKKHVSGRVLEVGTGDKGFTKQLISHNPNIDLTSIEPSDTFFQKYSTDNKFPDGVSFLNEDLFKVTSEQIGTFDTIIFIHVLEHIENDADALIKAKELLNPGGKILIEVPALPILFSEHDTSLGHYRRYTKSSLRKAFIPSGLTKLRMWYQDPIGVFGSFIFFKVLKKKLDSPEGTSLVKNEGNIYDKVIIPIEGFIEKFITFPFGLSLTVILKKD